MLFSVNNLAVQIMQFYEIKICNPKVPTPAAARYWITGLPRPPAPMTSTFEAIIFF
jgi:hypothetical protein